MKIAIANDSPLAVEMLRRALSRRPEHEIIWIVEDGRQAIEQTRWQRPDLILMDIQMPDMDGVEATRQIMRQHPCPILIVTFDVGVNASKVFDAMAAGAIDAVDTPAPNRHAPEMMASLLGKIDPISRQHEHNLLTSNPLPPIIETLTTGAGGPPLKASLSEHSASKTAGRKSSRFEPEKLVVIGASAGGPLALAQLLSGMPADYAGAIVIVQHLDHQFADGLARWLDDQTAMPVALATEGMAPCAGQVLIAGIDQHLFFRSRYQLGYTRVPENVPHRPSIDILFSSVATCWGKDATCVLLTGMGRDGAQGMLDIKQQGGKTIAQDQGTSTVFGMPKAAISLGAAQIVLPLHEIAEHLMY